ncbi:MAG: response regulator transcription factor [Oscillospiraceae bacterium]|nr:response regulator transcription factor [Oscillospiraceae bacterium]
MNDLSVLVVEDDASVRNLMTMTLHAHQYRYRTAEDGESAILALTSHSPDVVLLDLGLPDMDGVDIIRRLRTWSDMPVIVISARSDDADKITALDAGADDYLTKPFSVDELLARLRVVQRRLARLLPDNEPVFTNGALEIDYGAAEVRMAGRVIALTPNEYKLLCLFAKNVGRVLTHTYITDRIWGNSLDSDVATLRVFMASLRKKMENEPSQPKLFQTHVGIGYRMNKL